MKKVSISGSPRANVGKKDAKTNRNNGLIPAVLYGGKEQFTLTVEEKAVLKLLSSPEVFTLGLNLGNKEYNCIIKETQFHPVTDKIIHVDFLEIFENKPVILEIPVKLTGTSPGVLMGGKLQIKQRKLKAKGIYTKLPDDITLDISGLEIGDSIKIGNIKHDHVELLDNPSSVVVSVKLTRAGVSAAQEEEEAAAAATPAAEQKETKE